MKKSLLCRTIAKSKQGSSQFFWTRSKQTLNIVIKDFSFLRAVYTLKMYAWKIND